MAIAEVIVRAAAVYAAAGALFAAAFLARGLREVDPVAAAGTRGFKLIVLPGVIGLWPVLVCRWISARRSRAR